MGHHRWGLKKSPFLHFSVKWEMGFNAAAQTEAARGWVLCAQAAASWQSPLGSVGARTAQDSRCGRVSITRYILKVLKLGVSKLSSDSDRKWQQQGLLKLTLQSNNSSSERFCCQDCVCFIWIKSCNVVVKGFLAAGRAKETIFSFFDSLQSLM